MKQENRIGLGYSKKEGPVVVLFPSERDVMPMAKDGIKPKHYQTGDNSLTGDLDDDMVPGFLDAVIAFVNARSLDELMNALEALYLRSRGDLFPEIRFTVTGCNLVSWNRHRGEVAKMFYGPNPGRGRGRDGGRTREDIERWPVDLPDDWSVAALKLADVVVAKNDMVRMCRVLAWIHGLAPWWSADDLVRVHALDALDTWSDSRLATFYRGLAPDFRQSWRPTGDGRVSWLRGDNVKSCSWAMIQYDAISIVNTVRRRYVPGHPWLCYCEPDALLPVMWECLFSHIIQEEPRGAVRLCSHCKRFVIRRSAKEREKCSSCQRSGYSGGPWSDYWPSETWGITTASTASEGKEV